MYELSTSDNREYGLLKPGLFDMEFYLDVIESIIAIGEIHKAKVLLSNLPAYYREKPYPRAVEIFEKLK